MNIGNIRLGFATNSSSSHSVIILPKGKSGPSGSRWFDEGEYGWDNFVLSSRHDKMAYLAAQLGDNLKYLYGVEMAKVILAELFPSVEWHSDWYVDHQSAWSFPVNSSTGHIDMEFVRDLNEFLMRNDEYIIILQSKIGYLRQEISYLESELRSHYPRFTGES